MNVVFGDGHPAKTGECGVSIEVYVRWVHVTLCRCQMTEKGIKWPRHDWNCLIQPEKFHVYKLTTSSFISRQFCVITAEIVEFVYRVRKPFTKLDEMPWDFEIRETCANFTASFFLKRWNASLRICDTVDFCLDAFPFVSQSKRCRNQWRSFWRPLRKMLR